MSYRDARTWEPPAVTEVRAVDVLMFRVDEPAITQYQIYSTDPLRPKVVDNKHDNELVEKYARDGLMPSMREWPA